MIVLWHYPDSNVDLVRRSINKFDWDKAFANKHVDEKVLIFNKTFNILSNFIPHEVLVCDDKDPPWLNAKIKTLIKGTSMQIEKALINDGLRVSKIS